MAETIENVESNDEAENESKPLLNLFKHIIGNDDKQSQNMILTNTEILKILRYEFNMEVSDLHELEINVYLNVIKKFLKDWPQWDEFDKIINNLKNDNDYAGIKTVLELKYNNLKEYLKAMLRAAEPIVKETIKSLPPDLAPSTSFHTVSKDSNDVVLEVCCTRSQLHQLIYKHPIPGVDTIFNIEDIPGPSRISLLAPSFDTIMNWWCFSININLSALVFKRETVHDLRHFLVNKKLNIKTDIPAPNTCFQEKVMSKARNQGKANLMDVLDRIKSKLKKTSYKNIIEIILSMLKKDLNAAPDTLKVPAMYRKCFNKHPYVRYLYTDPELPVNATEAKKYDLHIEETIIPMYKFQILKVDNSPSKIGLVGKEFLQKIFIECQECKIKFRGEEILKDIQQHFQICHQNEPDWQCRNCHRNFTMSELSNRRWCHKC